jgi:hypothetical protein
MIQRSAAWRVRKPRTCSWCPPPWVTRAGGVDLSVAMSRLWYLQLLDPYFSLEVMAAPDAGIRSAARGKRRLVESPEQSWS